MWRSSLVSVGLGSLVLFASVSARAQCSMDTDCKGERICEEGRCIDPPPAAAAPATAPAPVPPAAPPRVALPPEPAAPPKMVRHSKGMMAGGIVMTALAPVALLVSGTAAISASFCNLSYDSDGSYRNRCDYDGLIYGSLLTGVVLLGVGIPLIVIGAKKEPESQHLSATVAPWASPSGAGLGLRLEL